MSYSTSVYQVLKAIDDSYENNNFNFEETLSLEKLKISERRLNLILEGLVNDNFIIGFSVDEVCFGDDGAPEIIQVSAPRLTISGMDYLENNSSMKKAYNTLKELKDWIPGI
ncbi:MAG: YjcQ family protein [Cetobacterium sp.]|uniref:YjcQ family protein n=1 Tax=Cetobacterium sp. TaxID=2071632 RepID=UPI003F36C198